MNKGTGKNRNAPTNQTVRRILFSACSIAFALALTVSQSARCSQLFGSQPVRQFRPKLKGKLSGKTESGLMITATTPAAPNIAFIK